MPYELEGWSKGQDLSKMDQKVLQQKVVTYYQKLWNILNNGEGEEFLKLWKKSNEELSVFHYLNINDIKNEKTFQGIKNAKGRMAPLEDYKMKLYADGKIVTLESHTDEVNGKKMI